MFTGIVTELGTVAEVEPTDTGRHLVIEAPETTKDLVLGDSVAVNGVCLTAVAVEGDRFAVDAVTETLERSNLGEVVAGGRIDLERPVSVAGGRFDGHVVQGHVHGVGAVESVLAEGEARRVRVSAPDRLGRYFVEKGSVTLDGVSLTITAVSAPGEQPTWFEVVLIPHTLAVTVLGERTVGDRVNIEADSFAKYIERLMEART